MLGNVMVPYLRVLQAPPCEPVSLELAKLWCKARDADNAIFRDILIPTVRARSEYLTGRAWVKRQLELRLDCFPSGGKVIEFPVGPVISVDSISYTDTAGHDQALTGSVADTGSAPGRVQPAIGQDWPSTAKVVAAVRIAFTCGYEPVGSPQDEDAHQAAVPGAALAWMEARMLTLYDKRDQLVVGSVMALPRDFVDGLLYHLKINKGFA